MKKERGILVILLFMFLSAILWYFEKPIVSITPINQISYIIGGLALTGFFFVFLLSARLKWVEKLFNGLDYVYVVHKYIAIFSIGAVIVHFILTKVGATGAKEAESIATGMGSLAMLSFVALTLVALFAKKMKYEKWRFFHRLLIIPYVLGIYHTYFTEKYNLFTASPLGIWTAITSIIWLGLALYMLLFYQKIKFKNNGSISAVNRLSPSALELELSLDYPMSYEKGQYAFVKIFQQGIEKAPHPFSISGGDGNKIYLSIKVLGDYTKQLYDEVKVGTKVSLDGPYGHMIFANGKNNQLWVAGGIGIAPFISYLKGLSIEQNVELYYSYRGQNEEIYKEFLEAYERNNPNFKVYFTDTSMMKRLDFNSHKLKDDTSVFMCGPTKMINNYAKQIKEANKDVDITFEAFNFR